MQLFVIVPPHFAGYDTRYTSQFDRRYICRDRSRRWQPILIDLAPERPAEGIGHQEKWRFEHSYSAPNLRCIQPMDKSDEQRICQPCSILNNFPGSSIVYIRIKLRPGKSRRLLENGLSSGTQCERSYTKRLSTAR